MRTITVGTRQSALALTQTGQVIDRLKGICEREGIPCEFRLRKIVTRGDRILDVTLNKIGGKALFVKEIEQALLDGEADMAVHSMKDMPSELPSGLINGGIPLRVDPRDCLVSRDNRTLDELPPGARVATSSLRRASQLLHARPDLKIEAIRGNIDTRLSKLMSEGFDAVVLAAAGLIRMGWEDRISQLLSPELCLPAVGQGALAIECREDDRFMQELLTLLHDPETAAAVAAERSFLARLDGGCQHAIAAHAVLDPGSKDRMTLTGMVAKEDGSRLCRSVNSGSDPEVLGVQLAEELLSMGGAEILSEFREEARG